MLVFEERGKPEYPEKNLSFNRADLFKRPAPRSDLSGSLKLKWIQFRAQRDVRMPRNLSDVWSYFLRAICIKIPSVTENPSVQ